MESNTIALKDIETLDPCQVTMVQSLLCDSSAHRRSVRFEDSVTFIREDANYDNDSDNDDTQEQASTWYSQTDFDRFRAENFLHLQQSRLKGAFTENQHWSPRGFENISMGYPRKQLRLEHMDGVLYFQDIFEGDCPTTLADYAYHSSSSDGSGARARALAHQDQQEAAVIHQQSPRLECEGVKREGPIASTPASTKALTTPKRAHLVPGWCRPMLQFFRPTHDPVLPVYSTSF